MAKALKFLCRFSFSILLLLFLLTFSIILTPRKTMVKIISENPAPITQKTDIYFVFSGGFRKNSTPGYSTKERLNFLKKLLSIHPNTPFVFLDYRRGKKIASDIMKEYNSLNLSRKEGYKYNPHISGTVNNVRELVNFLKKHPQYKSIGIITSAYHEKRIKILLDYYLKKNKLNVRVYFFHDKQQEIFNCSTKRYLSLIIHEILGIIYVKLITLF